MARRYSVTAIEKAFPSLDLIAAHRPLSPATEALRHVYVIHYNGLNSSRDVAHDLASIPAVRYAEPVYTAAPIHTSGMADPAPTRPEEQRATPDDPLYDDQTHLPYVKLDKAWDIVKGENGTAVIAIVDGGTYWQHEDLAGNVWTNPNEIDGDGIDNDNNGYVDDIHGWNFENNKPDPDGGTTSFGNQHGTAVTGAAAAVTDNTTGITGASWNAKFMGLNTSCAGGISYCYTEKGILYASLNGADVINASFSTRNYSQTWEMIYASATDEGAIVVAGSGNAGIDIDVTPTYPASFSKVLSVGGLKKTADNNAFNYGQTVNVFAPGTDIEGTFLRSQNNVDTYGKLTGSSMASPLVAGIAALVKTAFPHFNAHQVREQIRLTAISIDHANNPPGKFGRGKVDAYAAVTADPLPGIRVIDWSYQHQYGNQEAGSTGHIAVTVTFTNYHGAGHGLNAELSSDASYLEWITQNVSLGTMSTGDTLETTFRFAFTSSAPNEGTIALSPKITAPAFVDSPDLFFLSYNQGFNGTFSLTATPTSVSEAAGPTIVTVTATSTLERPAAQVIPITVTGSGVGSAVDFSDVTGFALTMPANTTSSSTTFTLTPTDDQVDETDETITIGTSSALVIQSATVTLTDNDDAPAGITLSVTPTLVVEDDGDTPITVTATVTGGTTYGTAQSLNLTVAGSGTPNAVGFTPVTGVTLPVAAAAASGKTTFMLTPLDNNDVNTPETITISSSSAVVSNTTTIELHDDDVNLTIALTVSPASVAEGDGPTPITVTATSTDTFNDAQVVPITVRGSGDTAAVDFVLVDTFNLTLPAHVTSTTGTFTLTPTDDQVDEADETIRIQSTHLLVTQSGTLTLTDDDATPTVILHARPTSVYEGDGSTTITIAGVATGGTTFGTAQSLDLTVSGSGTPSAVKFAPVSGVVLPVAAEVGRDSTTFILTPTDNSVRDANETITISSSSLVSNTVTITLYDNDGGTPITLSADPTMVSEGDGAAVVTVTASSRTLFTSAQVLPISVMGSGIAEAVDYAPVSDFDLTLAANQMTARGTFTLTPTDDSVDEADETLLIISASPLVQDSTTVVLQDDDPAPDGVQLSVAPAFVNEDGGATTITVTATVSGDTRYGIGKMLNLSVTGSGVSTAVGFVAVPDFFLTVPAEAASGTGSFVLTPENDAEGESDETITISSDSTFVLSVATLVLQDDDGGRTARDADAYTATLGVTPPYPNPASGQVTFVITATAPADWAYLRLYNMLGQEVAVPFAGSLRTGERAIRYDGRHLPAGMYVYVFESQDARVSGQLVMAH